MRVTFQVTSESNDVYQVTLSSGKDAFFATEDVCAQFCNDVEIVEIDLDRVSGNNPTSLQTLSLISEGIARYFSTNNKAVLYYYCDDLDDVPKSSRKGDVWPQEYRSHLFSLMFQRYLLSQDIKDVIDVTIMINQGQRPIYMHIIARKAHMHYINIVKTYIIDNYGK